MKNSKNLLNKYWDGKLPVNPMLFLNSDHITVQGSNDMDENTMIEISFNNYDFHFKYNAKSHILRQRYSLAYIVALYNIVSVYNLKSIDKIDVSYFQQGHILFSRNLNQFALNLLIPTHILKFIISKEKITDVVELANIFSVSENALIEQLKKAEIIN